MRSMETAVEPGESDDWEGTYDPASYAPAPVSEALSVIANGFECARQLEWVQAYPWAFERILPVYEQLCHVAGIALPNLLKK